MMDLNDKSDDELKEIMISLCIFWEEDDDNMLKPRQISRSEMIDLINERRNQITLHNNNLANHSLSSWDNMSANLPTMIIINIIRMTWEMETMTGRFKYRDLIPLRLDEYSTRYKWALSLDLVCKQFFNLVKTLFQRIRINYQYSNVYNQERLAKPICNDISQHISNVACVIQQPTYLSIQCSLLCGLTLNPSINIVILLKGITKLKLLGYPYHSQLEAALQLMVNLENLKFCYADPKFFIYQPSLLHLTLGSPLTSSSPIDPKFLECITNPIHTLKLPSEYESTLSLSPHIKSQIKRLRISCNSIPDDLTSNYTSLRILELTGSNPSKINLPTINHITHFVGEFSFSGAHRKGTYNKLFDIIPLLPSLTTLEDSNHIYCEDRCKLFCQNIFKSTGHHFNGDIERNGRINNIETIKLRIATCDYDDHHLTKNGLPYHLTSQRLKKNDQDRYRLLTRYSFDKYSYAGVEWIIFDDGRPPSSSKRVSEIDVTFIPTVFDEDSDSRCARLIPKKYIKENKHKLQQQFQMIYQ